MSKSEFKSSNCARRCRRSLAAQSGWFGRTELHEGQSRQDAKAHGSEPQVIKLIEATKGFVLLPKRCVINTALLRRRAISRLTKDY